MMVRLAPSFGYGKAYSFTSATLPERTCKQDINDSLSLRISAWIGQASYHCDQLIKHPPEVQLYRNIESLFVTSRVNERRRLSILVSPIALIRRPTRY